MRPCPRIAACPEVVELNIGHFLMGEALFVGLGPPSPRCAA
jgi:pyridoxine 5-phosphate synthase